MDIVFEIFGRLGERPNNSTEQTGKSLALSGAKGTRPLLTKITDSLGNAPSTGSGAECQIENGE
ncbi:MAG: hypothetical protein L6Q54_03045 [Leptospiraceae bacterium]|nr:hypothetical protein [Leptospiraceae bacterium]